jgi:hypothetical protein
VLKELSTFIDSELEIQYERKEPEWVVIVTQDGSEPAAFGTFTSEEACNDWITVQGIPPDITNVLLVNPPAIG